MSCSKPIPPFAYDLLCFLNRDQLERFSIVCRPLKNLIERYFHSKPYRVFDLLRICGGSYALIHINPRQWHQTHNSVSDIPHWHPNRDDYSVQQFLDGQICSIDLPRRNDYYTYYSFAEMRPYLGPTVRISHIFLYLAGDSIYNPEHIAEMESIAYLWRKGVIQIWNEDGLIHAEDFLPILNSPTILRCNSLEMRNAHFSFKNYKVLYSTKFFELKYKSYDDSDDENDENDPKYYQQFLEQPGVKPIVVLQNTQRGTINNLLDRLSKAFSSALEPNAFKIVFVQDDEPLTAFRETNETSGEILELTKGLPEEYEEYDEFDKFDNYTLERSKL